MTLHEATWRQVRSWRLRQHLLDRRDPAATSVVDIVTRLCGIHAQVMSAAELATIVRQHRARVGQVSHALTERRLVRMWAMRGTLHLLDPAQGSAFLTLLAATRSWESNEWQRRFLTTDEMGTLAEVVATTLDGHVLTRRELATAVEDHTSNQRIADHVRSSWGEVLKPLAWQGLVCHGPPHGRETTFTSPGTWTSGWQALHPDDAARIAIPAYLAAHGPATPATFDAWLTGGRTDPALIRAWFHAARDLVETVNIGGEPRLARASDVEDIRHTGPTRLVRMIPAFDQFILGVGARDPNTVPRQHRGQVSRAGGWISPTIVTDAGVIGTWRVTNTELELKMFDTFKLRNRHALLREAEWTARLLNKQPPAALVRADDGEV